MIPRSILLLTVLLISTSTIHGWTMVSAKFGRSNLQSLSFPLQLHSIDPTSGGNGDEEDYHYDEETARNPTEEVNRIKQQIEKAKEEGDMDTAMTLVGTLLALGGAHDTEA